MWFKSLTLFRFTEPCAWTLEQLERALARMPFKPCGAQDLGSRGWVAPLGRDENAPCVHAANGCWMISLQCEDKLLPASVIREVLDERVAEIEEREARKLRRKEKEALKDEVMQALLPRAFTRTRRMYAYLDPQGGWLVVNGTSGRAVDDFTSLLRKAVGGLPIAPVRVSDNPAAVMTHWLAAEGQALPAGFVLEDECELRDAGDEGGVVRCKGQDLTGEEIATHLAAGKQVTRLALAWDERVGCVLGDDLSVRRLRFLDLVQDELAATDTEDAADEFDARFALMNGELKRFLPALLDAFGGEAQAA